MKLYYTDINKNKRLIAESESIDDILIAVEEDAKRKFVVLKNLKIVNLNSGRYAFMKSNGEESGYSVEE